MGRLSDTMLNANYHGGPGYTDESTSRAAAAAVAGGSDAGRSDCLKALIEHGPMTADEVAEKIGRKPGFTRPRLSELKKAGLAEKTKERRRNESTGLSAAVYRARS
jgi:predicted ArsR family transcriptional regulator